MTTIHEEVSELLARGETTVTDEELRLLLCGRVVDSFPGRLLARLLAAGIAEVQTAPQAVSVQAVERSGATVYTARLQDGFEAGDRV